MFVARAGLSGRVLRQNRNQPSGIIALLGPKKKKKEPFRCWVPFMLRPCIAGFVGMLILIGGASMCVVGFYAEYFSLVKTVNGTTGLHNMTVQTDKKFHLHNMTYGGPVMMGFGCFIIVVSCVVVCEHRDKMLKIMIEEEEKKKKKKGYKPPPKKENIIERIIRRIKKCTEGSLPSTSKAELEKAIKDDIQKSKADLEEEKAKAGVFKIPCGSQSGKSEKSHYSHISDALKKIPMEIFSVDVEQNRKTSLIPVTVNKGDIILAHFNKDAVDTRSRSKSAPCLYDLMKYREGNMGQIYLPHEELFHRAQTAKVEQRASQEERDSQSDEDDSVSVCNEQGTDAEMGHVEEHRNYGFSSGEDATSADEYEEETDDEYDLLQTTCDTKDTYIALRLDTDSDANAAERGESRCSNGGSRHKVIVHQASVHSAGDSEDKSDPVVPVGYKQRNTMPDSKEEELICGVARANASAMDRFRRNKPSPPSDPSSTESSLDNVFMSESQAREFNLMDSSETPGVNGVPVSSRSNVDKYAVSEHSSPTKSHKSLSGSAGSHVSICDETQPETR